MGKLRFREPVPKRPWQDTLKADRYGSPCVQAIGNDTIGREDCLFLNIFTPVIPLDDSDRRLRHSGFTFKNS